MSQVTVWEIASVLKDIYLQISPFFFGFFLLFYYAVHFKGEKKASFSLQIWECIGGGFPIGYISISWISYLICALFYGEITYTAVYGSYALQTLLSIILFVKILNKLSNKSESTKRILMKELKTSKSLIILLILCTCYFTSVFHSHLLYETVEEYHNFTFVRWWSGGSVWADLAYHLGIINSFLYGENTHFSLFTLHKSPIYSGEPVSYPFIPNFHSTCLIFSGMSIRDSMLYSSIFLSSSTSILLFCFMRRFYRGFSPKDQEFQEKRGDGNIVSFFSVILFYLAGGIGFFQIFNNFSFDQIMNKDWIQFDENNNEIYWFSVFCHILLPQRTAMYGYPLLLIVFILLFVAIYMPHPSTKQSNNPPNLSKSSSSSSNDRLINELSAKLVQKNLKFKAEQNHDNDNDNNDDDMVDSEKGSDKNREHDVFNHVDDKEERQRIKEEKDYQIITRYFLIAGIITGVLPLVHAHSFLSIFFVLLFFTILNIRRSFKLSNRWKEEKVKLRSSPPSSPIIRSKNSKNQNNDNNNNNNILRYRKQSKAVDEENINIDKNEDPTKNVTINNEEKEGLFDYWIIFVIPILILFSFQIPSYLNRLMDGDSDGGSFVKFFTPIWRGSPWNHIFFNQFRSFISRLTVSLSNYPKLVGILQSINFNTWIDLNFFVMWFRALGFFLPLYFLSFFQLNRPQKEIYISFLSLFVIANLVIFQPWDKDNTKVFVIWLMVAAVAVVMMLQRFFLKFPTFSLLYLHENFASIRNFCKSVIGVILRWIVVFIFISLIFSGALMSVRENSLHNWEYMNTYDFELGEYVKQNTQSDDIFLIPKHSHIHPITNIAGRSVLYGYEGWIHSHGYKAMHERSHHIGLLLSNPFQNLNYFSTYNISYVVFSSEMAQSWHSNEEWFKHNTKLVFENNDYRLYDTRPHIIRTLKRKQKRDN